MSFFFNDRGNVQYAAGYNAQFLSSSVVGGTQIQTDAIRPPQLYVESSSAPEPGHLVHWTGSPAMFLRDGTKLSEFNPEHGHEYALCSVRTAGSAEDIAGVVMEVAATPSDNTYKHRGVHSTHPVFGNQHILRISRPGACVLAWVLTDVHQNRLNGLYTQFENGIETGKYVVRELGDEFFTIEEVNPPLSDVQAQVASLTARLNILLAEN